MSIPNFGPPTQNQQKPKIDVNNLKFGRRQVIKSKPTNKRRGKSNIKNASKPNTRRPSQPSKQNATQPKQPQFQPPTPVGQPKGPPIKIPKFKPPTPKSKPIQQTRVKQPAAPVQRKACCYKTCTKKTYFYTPCSKATSSTKSL